MCRNVELELIGAYRAQGVTPMTFSIPLPRVQSPEQQES